jgi:Uma2 family endonuclease
MIGQLSTQTTDAQTADLQLSPGDYLAWEAEQDTKHEYEGGKIVAMTGGTIPHSQVGANLSALLIPHLRGKKCKIAVSDAKVMIDSGKYYYPDLVISCDERDRNARNYIQYPCFIAEVLSPSTEARDRGIKQQNYMRIPTLDTYLLVDPDQYQVEIYERQEES